jgi:hypothetical protein
MLLNIRQAGAALDIHQIRSVIVAHIQYTRPEIFRTVVKRDGSTFAASTKWVQKFLAEGMNWMLRRCNRSIARLATQKVGRVVVFVCTSRVGFGVVLGCY